MKLTIALGAVLLIGVAFSLHRTHVQPGEPERRSPMSLKATPERVEGPAAEGLRQAGSPVLTPDVSCSQAAPKEGTSLVVAWRKVLGALEVRLELSLIQKPAMEGILRERESEIKACQDAMRKSGFVDLRQYDWQVGLMKEAWYQKIDALLDAPQHQRFMALVQQGLLNEGLIFTVEPGMTVLD